MTNLNGTKSKEIPSCIDLSAVGNIGASAIVAAAKAAGATGGVIWLVSPQ